MGRLTETQKAKIQMQTLQWQKEWMDAKDRNDVIARVHNEGLQAIKNIKALKNEYLKNPDQQILTEFNREFAKAFSAAVIVSGRDLVYSRDLLTGLKSTAKNALGIREGELVAFMTEINNGIKDKTTRELEKKVYKPTPEEDYRDMAEQLLTPVPQKEEKPVEEEPVKEEPVKEEPKEEPKKEPEAVETQPEPEKIPWEKQTNLPKVRGTLPAVVVEGALKLTKPENPKDKIPFNSVEETAAQAKDALNRALAFRGAFQADRSAENRDAFYQNLSEGLLHYTRLASRPELSIGRDLSKLNETLQRDLGISRQDINRAYNVIHRSERGALQAWAPGDEKNLEDRLLKIGAPDLKTTEIAKPTTEEPKAEAVEVKAVEAKVSEGRAQTRVEEPRVEDGEAEAGEAKIHEGRAQPRDRAFIIESFAEDVHSSGNEDLHSSGAEPIVLEETAEISTKAVRLEVDWDEPQFAVRDVKKPAAPGITPNQISKMKEWKEKLANVDESKILVDYLNDSMTMQSDIRIGGKRDEIVGRLLAMGSKLQNTGNASFLDGMKDIVFNNTGISMAEMDVAMTALNNPNADIAKDLRDLKQREFDEQYKVPDDVKNFKYSKEMIDVNSKFFDNNYDIPKNDFLAFARKHIETLQERVKNPPLVDEGNPQKDLLDASVGIYARIRSSFERRGIFDIIGHPIDSYREHALMKTMKSTMLEGGMNEAEIESLYTNAKNIFGLDELDNKVSLNGKINPSEINDKLIDVDEAVLDNDEEKVKVEENPDRERIDSLDKDMKEFGGPEKQTEKKEFEQPSIQAPQKDALGK